MYQQGMSRRQLDRARRRAGAGGYPLHEPRVIRASGALLPGVHSRYHCAVASGVVDRGAWAKVVQRLMDKHAHGRKATFAKLVGVDPRTVTDWLGEVYTVRDAMVRQVADRTGESALELLIEVGVLAPVARVEDTLVSAEDVWIVERIQASTLSPEKKKVLIAIELERAAREREERQRQIDEQIKLLQPER